MHVGLQALRLLTHQQQQRAAPAGRHHHIAAHDGAQRVRLQLLLRGRTAGKLRLGSDATTYYLRTAVPPGAGTAQGDPAISLL